MALAARFLQVIFVNHGFGVGGRPNIVHSVATGAVCGKSVSSLVGKAVESIIIRLYGGGGESIFL